MLTLPNLRPYNPPTPMPRHPRRGFSLTELVVVLTACSIALLLVAPAVQQSTQLSREAACKNNLRQLGLAMHNYHDVHDQFPTGWIQKSWAAREPQAFTWQRSLLPFLGQDRLDDEIERERSFEEAARRPTDPASLETLLRRRFGGMLRQSQKWYLCPSAGEPGMVNEAKGGHLMSSYVANFGAALPPRLFVEADAAFTMPGAAAETPLFDRFPNGPQGLAACNFGLRFSSVGDGLSNTLMVGERGPANGGALFLFLRGNAYETDTVFALPPEIALPKRGQAGHPAVGSSLHRGGVNFCFGDGSVRAIGRPPRITTFDGSSVLAALATVSGGELLNKF